MAELNGAFISYASQDRKVAEELVRRLEKLGLTCWIAPRNISPGAEYGNEIVRGISQSQCLILLLSNPSNLSDMVLREVERAASLGKPIYPVRIEEVDASSRLAFFISVYQWLDVWPSLLDAHVERLANAITSRERWIGNKLVRRRNAVIRWGTAASLLGIAAAIAVFTPEIRHFFMSDQERAVQELRERNVSVDVRGVKEALVGADGRTLRLLARAGIKPAQIHEAFGQTYESGRKPVASIFFERSRTSTEASDWFRESLAAGLDPNLTVKSEDYEREGLLALAQGQGNTAATLYLLEAGASPHPIQALWLDVFPAPRALFPLSAALNSPRAVEGDRKNVTDALRNAGAVFYNRPSKAEFAFAIEYQDYVTKSVRAADRILDRALAETPPDRELASPPICTALGKRANYDWCSVAKAFGGIYQIEKDQRSFWDIYTLDVRTLISVSADTAYFFAVKNFEIHPEIVLLETNKDGRDWTIYAYRGGGVAGIGRCRPPENYSGESCWRRIKMTYEPQERMFNVSGARLQRK